MSKTLLRYTSCFSLHGRHQSLLLNGLVPSIMSFPGKRISGNCEQLQGLCNLSFTQGNWLRANACEGCRRVVAFDGVHDASEEMLEELETN